MMTNAARLNGSRERLLAVAARLFRKKGYAATSIREIAAHLGVRNASLYHYIQSKDELLFDVAEQSMEQLTARVWPIVSSTRPPIEKLRCFIEAHIAAILEERDKHAVMIMEMRVFLPKQRRAIVQARDKYELFVTQLLEEGQRAGVIRADLEVRYLKLALLNLMNSSIFWFRPGGPLSPNQVGQALSQIFLEGAAFQDAANKKVSGIIGEHPMHALKRFD